MSSNRSGGNRATASGAKMESKVMNAVVLELKRQGFKVASTPTKISIPSKLKSALFFEDPNNCQILLLKGKDLHKFAGNIGAGTYQAKFQKELHPDLALVNLSRNTLTILEVKNQNGAGSVDEKLQTNHFKQYYYQHIAAELGLELQLYWFLAGLHISKHSSKYEAILEYMTRTGAITEVFVSNPQVAAKRLVEFIV
jgi:hypothetical protein